MTPCSTVVLGRNLQTVPTTEDGYLQGFPITFLVQKESPRDGKSMGLRQVTAAVTQDKLLSVLGLGARELRKGAHG